MTNRYLTGTALVVAGLLASGSVTFAAGGHDIRIAQQDKVAAVADDERQTPRDTYRFTAEGMGSFLAGRQAKKDGESVIASHYYRRALAEDPDNDWLARRLFIINIGVGKIGESITMADRVLKTYEGAPVANLVQAVDHLLNDRFGKADAMVSQAMKSGAMRLIGPTVRAWAAFGNGNIDAAVRRLKPLESKKAQDPFRLYHKALLLGASGDTDGALAAFEELPDNARLDLRTRLIYASLLERRDGAEAASAYLKGLTARYGENPVLQAYMDGERPLAKAFPVVTAQHGIAEALYGTASALSQDSINEVSQIYLQMALYARPDLDVAQLLLGDMMDDGGHWEEAIAAFDSIATDSPYKWQARIRKAWSLDSLGRTEEAAELLLEMSDERPERLTTLATLADIYRGHRRFEEAAEIYARTIERIGEPGPRHWSIFYAHGIALERSKRWPEAEANLEKALELSPNQPLVMNYLGYSWADQGVKLDEAIAMIQRAVDLRPSDGYVIDSLGWAHFQSGDFKEAVKHLERATELRPEDPTINDHLGDVYWFVGRQRESCFQWAHALSLDPEEDQIPLIKRKLEEGLGRPDSGFRGCRF